MTISYVSEDIFKLSVEAIVNPVNTVGVMGRGLALEFKRRYYENYVLYNKACQDGNLKTGEVMPYKVLSIKTFNEPEWIVNVPTKAHWQYPSKLEWVISGLAALKDWALTNKIRSVAIPALGCGNGELDWETVRGFIEDAFMDEPVHAVIIPPMPM